MPTSIWPEKGIQTNTPPFGRPRGGREGKKERKKSAVETTINVVDQDTTTEEERRCIKMWEERGIVSRKGETRRRKEGVKDFDREARSRRIPTRGQNLSATSCSDTEWGSQGEDAKWAKL